MQVIQYKGNFYFFNQLADYVEPECVSYMKVWAAVKILCDDPTMTIREAISLASKITYMETKKCVYDR